MEYISTSEVKLSDYNPRKISEKDYNNLKKSIKEFGVLRPLIINGRTKNLISGHQMLKAAIEIGIEEMPVQFVDLTEEKEKALNLAMNKISGEFEEDKLIELIEQIYPWVQKTLGYRPTFIMWIKNGFSILARDYHSAYEPMLYFYYPEKKFRGSRGQTDTWFIKRRSTGKYVHPTMKPIALIPRAVENSSDENDIVLDLFGGSGSTMIACENTNRRCYMMELDPKYMEVIINRWQTRTNQTAVKL